MKIHRKTVLMPTFRPKFFLAHYFEEITPKIVENMDDVFFF